MKRNRKPEISRQISRQRRKSGVEDIADLDFRN